jgi:hypothetical protein
MNDHYGQTAAVQPPARSLDGPRPDPRRRPRPGTRVGPRLSGRHRRFVGGHASGSCRSAPACTGPAGLDAHSVRDGCGDSNTQPARMAPGPGSATTGPRSKAEPATTRRSSNAVHLAKHHKANPVSVRHLAHPGHSPRPPRGRQYKGAAARLVDPRPDESAGPLRGRATIVAVSFIR